MLNIIQIYFVNIFRNFFEQLKDVFDFIFKAVVYPMKLSQEGYRFGSSKQDQLNKSVVERLAIVFKLV